MDFLLEGRRERPGDDPIFSLNAKARLLASEGKSVINATIGVLLKDDGGLAVLPTVAASYRALPDTAVAGYAPIAGNPKFLRAVAADLLAPSGFDDRVAICATPGGSGALRIAIDNFVPIGGTILTSSFYWGPYATLAAESGRKLQTFNMYRPDGGFDVEALDVALGKLIASEGRAYVVLNTPCHNPTGFSLDADDWVKTVAVLEKHAATAPVTVMADIAYGYYAPAALDAAVSQLMKIADRALVLFAWSASKSFLQYGARVGALVAVAPDAERRKTLQNALTYSCRGMWSNCNAAGMAAVANVLADAKLNAEVIGERAELIAMLDERVAVWNRLARPAGLDYPRYDGGFFTTVFTDRATEIGAELQAEGIFVVPLQAALRVAMCAVNKEQIETIVAALSSRLGNS